jgi:Phosphoesterase family
LPVTSYLDCDVSVVCDTSAASIFGQGETWKSYEESMPSNCDKSNSGEYAVRHNPAVYYTKLSGCASRDVPYTQLATDLAGNSLPAFSFITPNLIDDMHDGTIAQGNAWLSSHLPRGKATCSPSDIALGQRDATLAHLRRCGQNSLGRTVSRRSWEVS